MNKVNVLAEMIVDSHIILGGLIPEMVKSSHAIDKWTEALEEAIDERIKKLIPPEIWREEKASRSAYDLSSLPKKAKT